MKRIDAIVLLLAFSWLALAILVMVSGVILRETRLGVIAQVLDKLPSPTGTMIFFFLWVFLLLGWLIPFGFALLPLLRKTKVNSDRTEN